jgi:DNA-binding transcriptional regulator YhcF (GntR family)
MRWTKTRFHFTEEMRQALEAARNEAIRLGHDYMGTEHLLLGLVSHNGTAADVLGALGVTSEAVREEVRRSIRPGKAIFDARRGEMPYTSRAKKALEFTMAEAQQLGQNYVGAEHLVLGLLREEKGIAAQVLFALGVSITRARTSVIGLTEGEAAQETGSFRVTIDDRSDRSIYEQIIAQVQEAVATGALRTGDRLQPVRRLADDLDIAPGTVARAYTELERLKVVVTEGARGTRIAERVSQQAKSERPDTLAGLLRPVAVAAFHMGASASELRSALDEAMKGIYE